jgi:hypothetical protein
LRFVMLARYLIPIAPLLLIGINSALCLLFYLCAKHEMRLMHMRWKRSQTVQASATEALKAQLAELMERLRDAEERTGVLVPPMPPKSGLNLSKRSQVIRMARHGDQIEKIAASLSLPQREVELLLKVHGCVVYSSKEPNTSAASSSVNVKDAKAFNL